MVGAGPEGDLLGIIPTLQSVLDDLMEEAKQLTELAQASAVKEAGAFQDCHYIDSGIKNFDSEVKAHAQCRLEA